MLCSLCLQKTSQHLSYVSAKLVLEVTKPSGTRGLTSPIFFFFCSCYVFSCSFSRRQKTRTNASENYVNAHEAWRHFWGLNCILTRTWSSASLLLTAPVTPCWFERSQSSIHGLQPQRDILESCSSCRLILHIKIEVCVVYFCFAQVFHWDQRPGVNISSRRLWNKEAVWSVTVCWFITEMAECSL